MSTFLHAVRQNLRTPAVTAVSILTLALGIGANTAIFSFVDRLLLRSLPVHDPTRLAVLGRRVEDRTAHSFSYPFFRELAGLTNAFSHLCAQEHQQLGLNLGGTTEQVRALLVSGNYFNMLGLQPALGRTFSVDEGVQPGGSPVAVVSHRLWMRALGADAGAVGRIVTLNGHSFTLIGVAPAGFLGTEVGVLPDLFVPITMRDVLMPPGDAAVSPLTSPNITWHEVMGRLRPGVRRSQAQEAVQLLARQLAAQGHENAETNLLVLPGARGIVRHPEDLGLSLILVFCVCLLVLAIGGANVAALQITKAFHRQKEFAVRLSLGARRRHLLQQCLAESALLAGAGAFAGLGVAIAVGRLFTQLRPPGGSSGDLSVFAQLDGRILGFTVVAATLAAVVAGLAPALHLFRVSLQPALQSGAVNAGRNRRGLRHHLVSLQVTLATVCVLGAGLCLRSVANLLAIDPGFEPSRVLAANLDLQFRNDSPSRAREFFARALERIRALPDVQAASLARSTPLGTSHIQMSVERIEGYVPQPDEFPVWHVNTVDSDYFRTLGIRLLRGRDFLPTDQETGRKVIVINAAAASRYWPNQDPIGRHLHQDGFISGEATDMEIIGVVADAPHRPLTDRPGPAFYRSLRQFTEGSMTLVVRAAQDPRALTASLRRVVQELDPQLSLSQVRTLEDQRNSALIPQRLAAMSLTAFAGLALLLAGLGIHGMLAFNVARRVREIGIRMALGADRGGVVRLVVVDGLRLVIVGGGIGLALALAASQSLRGFLHGLSPQDPATVGAVLIALMSVGLAAAWFPAWRASRVNPSEALRHL